MEDVNVRVRVGVVGPVADGHVYARLRRVRQGYQAAGHSPLGTAASSSKISVSFSCLSGGYPHFRRVSFGRSRRWARTFSHKAQSAIRCSRRSRDGQVRRARAAGIRRRSRTGCGAHRRRSRLIDQVSQAGRRGGVEVDLVDPRVPPGTAGCHAYTLAPSL